MARILYGLQQSPWTERARWALDHHGIVYDYHEHLPMLGEVLLRRKARAKKASVPLLCDGDTVVMGSFAIAKHAENVGRGAPLFPRDSEQEIARWEDVAERMTRVGRAWVLSRLAASRAAQAESLPAFIPNALRGPFAPSAGMALRFLQKKYAVPADIQAEITHTLRPLLLEVRAGIAANRPYLLPQSFTFADMAVSSTMQILKPLASAKLGPATREAWTNEDLVTDFGDLLEWRDAIYRKHR
jgi:glutathione S-transferase